MKIKYRNTLARCCLFLLTFAGVFLIAPVSPLSQTQSQTVTPQAQAPPTPPDTATTPGPDDVTQRELANFDTFLDSHPEISEQLRKDPSLVDNRQFVESHAALQQYLADHPGAREAFKSHPEAFMHDENRFDRREGQGPLGITRAQLVDMDEFMRDHPEITEQLRKDPSLIDNKQFVESHAALQQFLADHPGVRDEFKSHPEAFMHDENRFDRREDQGALGITRAQLVDMDEFMRNHPEITEQLRKDPSLIDNKQFVENHAALQQFLADHPGVRDEFKSHPEAFMHDEERFDRRADQGRGRVTSAELSSFSEFLGNHNRISDELSKNPLLADNKEYLENHPDLREYLNTHPQAHQALSEDPGSFIKEAQQFDTHTPKMAGEMKPNK
jgi:hypothetical protein